MILYEGPSLLDGSTPIVVVATEDSNPKTGRMLYTWILRQDRPPEVAAYDGSDDAICGDCKFRHKLLSGKPDVRKAAGQCPSCGIWVTVSLHPTLCDRCFKKSRTCYVRLSPAEGADEETPPSEVWRKWKAGELRQLSRDWSRPTTKHYWNYTGPLPVRIGSYGDPAAVPTRVWAELVRSRKHWTGYSHFYKPRKCKACAQESRTRATCIDGGTDLIDSPAVAGSGMASGPGAGTDRCGIEEDRSTPTDSHGSGSWVNGPKRFDTLATTRAASTPDTCEEEPTLKICGTVSSRGGTSRASQGNMSGGKSGHPQDDEEPQETNEDVSCAKCNGTGYEWMPDPDLKRYCMASVDTPEERAEAQQLGWRTFMVVPEKSVGYYDAVMDNTSKDVLCPATDPHPKRNATCSTCLLCRGTSAPAPSIWEVAHGVNKENHTW